MNNKKNEIMTGTTIVAIKTPNSVIIGADTRTSSGRFIPSRYTDKLTKLTDTIYCCRSGSAADTMYIANLITMYLEKQEYLYNTKPTVKLAATYCQELIYSYPDFLAGMIVAGFDEFGPSVYTITLGGTIVKGDYAIGGSGSIHLYSFFDENFRNDFTDEQGLAFVKKAVSAAIKRDNFSGGCVRMARITNNNLERYFIPGNELS
ncbi:hypothetical protein EDEG_03164 [Edhazardia aedis USNM 41457]|uniref:proteasome endopeptidase complex n=1 Tax=Edhazardia aedis (strain USNM 41457) TaxID=1003232 RepID=J9DIG4_EDHAE|nr:hypothetical protein EDEG_03164 [Edhazardia aedis USNM 41457]|eukprot:EJW02410.1 hypothetical protein EDEG_03164 [Edhazardia aedis USNM 41457]